MAEPASFISMGELLEECGETEEDDVILDKIKDVARRSLPDGWLNWKTLNPSENDLFGDIIDPQILNKIRFALPTMDCVKIFLPEVEYIAEKPFRELKVSMLKWALCRALIISPLSIVNRVKGSVAQAEIFLSAIRPLRNFILTRREVCRLLHPETEEEDESSVEPEFTPKRSRVDLLEDKVEKLFGQLNKKIDALRNPSARQQPTTTSTSSTNLHLSDRSDEENDSGAENIYPSEEDLSDLETSFHAPELEFKNCPSSSKKVVDITFAPEVKVDDPPIPAPSELIKAQGIACQKLGSSDWNKIRYKEVQKKLRAWPVFDALKVNDQLGGLSKRFGQDLLSNMDTTLGTICHGMLKQREALVEQIKALTVKYPNISEDAQSLLSDDTSSFKRVSNDLLHYTCARRAEIIEYRRKGFKPANDFFASKLSEIPPSESHLFDETRLDDFINKNGGFFSSIPFHKKTFAV
ncbi:hypothetical protein ACJJTC_006921 [Scirpophaga incertulas]